MVIEDSAILDARIDMTMDKEKIFGYTLKEKIERLNEYKVDINNLLQNWMYPVEETQRLKHLIIVIDTHIKKLSNCK